MSGIVYCRAAAAGRAGSQLSFPLDDPAAYVQVARHPAQGRGFVSDVIWNYWIPFDTLPHPSNEFWMPLASVLMAAAIKVLGDTLLAAQFAGAVCGSLLVVLAYGTGRTLWLASAIGVLALTWWMAARAPH